MYKHYTCSTKLSYHHINLISSQYSFNGFRSLWKLFHKTFTSRLKTTTWLKVWNQYQCFNNYRHILLTRTVRLGYTNILEGIGLHVSHHISLSSENLNRQVWTIKQIRLLERQIRLLILVSLSYKIKS
jgi:hypothetical protein